MHNAVASHTDCARFVHGGRFHLSTRAESSKGDRRGCGRGSGELFEGTTYSSKVLQQMKSGVGEFHSFPESVRAFEDAGAVRAIKGGDGQVYQMLEIPVRTSERLDR